ncbi:Ubiquitin carboxyl-terminal hydrolase 5 [Histomonas meleagridis]|uniref:Ubiquitin carboxyl-terminal hydrolase 5 n=1 Tax=Histomonas meleagridis TaxID=135588 RepID=UPI003559689B|nr:Ubiquitin carboxyl-terminal hydrolase 5 [Histomonas meleagridis]KAH0799251.1 Ubiquitin carboxyl-terminal hydrolase 5 [Histomonas meleagridis]
MKKCLQEKVSQSEDTGSRDDNDVNINDNDELINPEAINAITEMGFTRAQAEEALRNNNGNIERAVASLLPSSL